METEKNETKRPAIGILAHVDAGKTTLSESLLYLSGSIRKMGRVDAGDAFLDTDETEKKRGITIYSKMALLPSKKRKDRVYTLLDTPGHADFSPEMERVLSVLDCAVLLISAPDGVNPQVEVFLDLLSHYRVPVILFVNKTDQMEKAGLLAETKEKILEDLKDKLSGRAVDLTEGLKSLKVCENIALASEDEALVETVMEGKSLSENELSKLVMERRVFPVLFGSALKNEGVSELFSLLDTVVAEVTYPSEFSARVIKIGRDAFGERETFLRVTGGRLLVRQMIGEEKVTGIRLYSGSRFTTVQEASSGTVCAVMGLSKTRAGEGVGAEKERIESVLSPVLSWELILPDGTDSFKTYRELSVLEEEEPSLSVTYSEKTGKISVSMMGEVQREIFAGLVKKRLGLSISYGRPGVVYKETIADTVEGVGHFEPLRHYAEVHLLLEPGEAGSGLVFESACPTDILAKRFQRTVLTQLAARRHRGVLTGAALTDVKISLIGGRAHEKHTEGGDFRQAAFRALRQGLMEAKSVLLEPFYGFTVTVPKQNLGRVLADLEQMGASFSQPDITGNMAKLSGEAPVLGIGAYQELLSSYTSGQGKIALLSGSYKPCADAERVIEGIGYDPEADLSQSPSSVFCSHGAAVTVPWYEVKERMHVPACYDGERITVGREEAYGVPFNFTSEETAKRKHDAYAAEEELKAIFEKTYGPVKRRLYKENEKKVSFDKESAPYRPKKKKNTGKKEYLLVDGYNIIFAWENLRSLADRDIKAARDTLLDILSDYAGASVRHVICVFDAYQVPGGTEQIYRYHNIDVIFTREAETADEYIEKAAHELSKDYRVSVATSDHVEQVIIFGTGAGRLSALDLLSEVVLQQESVREQAEALSSKTKLKTDISAKVSAALSGKELQ